MTLDVNCEAGGRHELSNTGLIWPVFACSKCKMIFRYDDVLQLANAAMQLTADEAEDLLEILPNSARWLEEYDHPFLTVLEEYARRWRGE